MAIVDMETHKCTTLSTRTHTNVYAFWNREKAGRQSCTSVRCSSLQGHSGGRLMDSKVTWRFSSPYFPIITRPDKDTFWLAGIWINNINKIAGHFVSELAKPLHFIEMCDVSSKQMLYVWLYVTLGLLRLWKWACRHRWSACQPLARGHLLPAASGWRVCCPLYTPKYNLEI